LASSLVFFWALFLAVFFLALLFIALFLLLARNVEPAVLYTVLLLLFF